MTNLASSRRGKTEGSSSGSHIRGLLMTERSLGTVGTLLEIRWIIQGGAAEVTEEGQEKMQQDLEAIHQSFKKLIADHRKEIDIEEVATGEFWLAEEAKDKGLVDEILTSDDYLFNKMDDFEIIQISTEDSRNRLEKILQGGTTLLRSWSRGSSLKDSELPNMIQ